MYNRPKKRKKSNLPKGGKGKAFNLCFVGFFFSCGLSFVFLTNLYKINTSFVVRIVFLACFPALFHWF